MSAYDWQPSQEDSRDFQPQSALSVNWGSSEYVEVQESEFPDYDGPYEVTPRWEPQTFDTANHVTRENLTVNGIVKLEVDNESGGLTLTI